MTDRAERLGDSRDGRRLDGRVFAALLLVVLLVLAGGGVGTLVFPGGLGDDDGTETAVRATPVTTVPTPGGPGSGTAASTSSPASPTRTEATGSSTPRGPESGNSDPGDPDSRDPGAQDPGPRDPVTTTKVTTDDGGEDSSLDLRVRGSAVFAELAAVEPGDAGESSVRFENAGDRPGRLLVSELAVTDHENGLLGPERAAGDEGATGDLSDALRVRFWATAPDGTATYVYGSPSGYVPLAGLSPADASAGPRLAGGDQTTVTLGWTLPASTGNRVQSDRVEIDIAFALRSGTA